ncbi:MAG: 16S rRNA (cytosine(1402)-N(4))-methyltransferase RsmH [Candidatus Buchananbacteria bacterium]
MATIHEPVLLKEVIKFLDPRPGKNFIDCTFGGGGHSLELVEKVKPNGLVVGIDWDCEAVKDSSNDNLVLVNDNYKNLKKIYQQIKNDRRIDKIDGILLDLGLSSDQLGARNRGFSFQDHGVLDMRYSVDSSRPSASEILNTYNQQDLFKIFKDYGEEPLAWQISKAIINKREIGEKIETVEMLVQLVSSAYQKHFKTRSKKNPATRVFQALRIAVNDELGNLMSVLPQAVEILSPGGIFAIISFHSLEDRIVKNYFKEEANLDYPRLKMLIKKPIIASDAEILKNPRSRSAKLRVVEKL